MTPKETEELLRKAKKDLREERKLRKEADARAEEAETHNKFLTDRLAVKNEELYRYRTNYINLNTRQRVEFHKEEENRTQEEAVA